MDSASGGLAAGAPGRSSGAPGPGELERGSPQRNPVADFYQTWWISPQGAVFDALRAGAPGHCAWLEEKYGICSRDEARRLGWVRVGWNLTRFYVDGRPARIEANRTVIEELLGRHQMVTEVLLEQGSDLDSILTPEEFLAWKSP